MFSSNILNHIKDAGFVSQKSQNRLVKEKTHKSLNSQIDILFRFGYM